MTTLILEAEPVIENVIFSFDKFSVELEDGRTLSVPLEWYPRLLVATDKERANWQLLGDGFGIEWPDLDEHISVEGLLGGAAAKANARLNAGWQDANK